MGGRPASSQPVVLTSGLADVPRGLSYVLRSHGPAGLRPVTHTAWAAAVCGGTMKSLCLSRPLAQHVPGHLHCPLRPKLQLWQATEDM